MLTVMRTLRETRRKPERKNHGGDVGKALIGAGAIAFALLVVLVASMGSSTKAPAAHRDASQRYAPVELPSMDLSGYDDLCREKWSTRGVLDQRMFEHCVSREREGYSELAQAIREHSDVPFLRDVVAEAAKKWTDRGRRTDSMVAHTVKREIEGYLDIAYEMGQPSVNKERLERCLNKWDIQYSMVVHCYKTER